MDKRFIVVVVVLLLLALIQTVIFLLFIDSGKEERHPVVILEPKESNHHRDGRTVNTVAVETSRSSVQRRPPMRASSASFLNAIRDAERSFAFAPGGPSSKECDEFGGLRYVETLNSSRMDLLLRNDDDGSSRSRIVSFANDDMDVYYAENVAVVAVLKNASKRSYELTMHVDGVVVDDAAAERLRPKEGRLLRNMTLSIAADSENDSHSSSLDGLCREEDYINHPVMLVDSNGDHKNWWWFLIGLLKHFVVYAIMQPHVADEYKQGQGAQGGLQVVHTVRDKPYARPFTDGFDLLFADRRELGDSPRLWDHPSAKSVTIDGGGEQEQCRVVCFRKVFWSPHARSGAREILINKRHEHDRCYSSILTAFAAYLRASVRIPALPNPPVNPRVVWVGRDTTDDANPTPGQKRRIIQNQAEIIRYLKNETSRLGCDFFATEFYGDEGSNTAYQEQAQLISRANVMIGVHGAGLNLFFFMPFDSVIVEVHLEGTRIQRNSANTVNHIGGTYLSVDGTKDKRGNLDPEPVWFKLREGIEAWKRLNHG